MNPEILERVMNCRSLPTLPAVAMRVVELTNSDKVSMRDLAETIQNDQGLSAKVLRTVNSSLFGLRARCASINQAIVMLGLSTVKTLALGFSLVGAIKDAEVGGMDLSDYWRRALFSGISGRSIAAKAGLANPEEAFLGGLLQDLGMIALSQTLGPSYSKILAAAKGDHRLVCKLELEALEIQHPDVGAMLARRWKLPESLVMPIKYHERASAAPVEHSSLCRAVGLGNIAADILISPEPAVFLRKFYQRADQWFGLTTLQADDVLKVISSQTREIAHLLNVPTGGVPSAESVIESARRQLALIVIPPTDDDAAVSSVDVLGVDDLTGAANRYRLEQSLMVALEQARANVGSMAFALFDIEELDAINAQFGTDAGDTVLINIAGRLDRLFRPMGGVVSRFDAGRFAALVAKADRSAMLALCERARLLIAGEPIRLIAAAHGAPPEVTVSCSVGVMCVDHADADRYEDVSHITRIVEQASIAAKKAGRNNIRVYAPLAA